MTWPPSPERFALDTAVRRRGPGGRLVLGGSPLRLFRLSDAGASILDGLQRGDPRPDTPAARRLADRLLDAGVLHPRGAPRSPGPNEVTVVIPVRNGDPGPTVASLGPVGRIIVVDDGSDPPVVAPDGVELVRRPTIGGPGPARQTGLSLVSTPFAAVVDADVTATDDWLAPLLPHFDDPRVALVAPRVASPAPPGASVLARYESVRSPLDLGPTEGRIRARTRIAYVPAAAFLARTAALRSVGGFDAALDVGEDVDLVWRLDEAGWRCRYEPASQVRHAPRGSLGAWLDQRRSYGRSAGPLARRHPGALAPVAVSRWSALAWALALSGHPVGGVGVTAATAMALAGKLRDVPPAESVRLAVLGTVGAGRQLANGVTRAWWPVAVAAGLLSRRARWVVLTAAVLPAAIDWLRTRPPIDPIRYVGLRLLDDGAYGLGLWAGCVAARTAAPLTADLTSWPHPARYERAGRPPS